MVYRIDNRPNRHKGRNIGLGILFGVILTIGVLVITGDDKEPIIQKVVLGKNMVVNPIQPQPTTSTVTSGPRHIVQHNIIQKNPTPQILESTPPPQQTININSLENKIHILINQQRINNGLNPLNYNQKVANIARYHSQDMIDKDYFDHTSPTGETFQSRMYNANIPCLGGENIQENYISTPDLENDIIYQWMSSSGHRNNILGYFSEEGIGIAIRGDAIMITEDFC